MDELWNQPSYDLWEALTHSPARENPFHFIVTYAGFQARSGNLLWDLTLVAFVVTTRTCIFFWRSVKMLIPPAGLPPTISRGSVAAFPNTRIVDYI